MIALSGVALNKESLMKPKITAAGGGSGSTTPTNEQRNKKPIAPLAGSSSSSLKSIDSLMEEIVDLLEYDNKYVRESIMSLTGTSLSPTVYPVLTRYLIQHTQKNIGTAGQIITSPKATLFVDQSISLLKHTIELQQESDNLSLLSDLEVLLESLAKYISQLEVDETSIKIRKTYCTLLDSLMQKRQSISFRNEVKFRNNLIDIIIGWTSDFAVTTSPK